MNIYIGNLDFNTQENDINELFSGYGEVSEVNIIKDKFTGKGRGFGFVEMSNDDEALSAIDQLNESELHGRKIIVNKAKPPRT